MRTNFEDGDWEATCPHCGEKQAAHRKTCGPDDDGNMYEHRMPCEPERRKIQRGHRLMVSTGKMLVLIWLVFLPLCVLLLTQFVVIFGLIAFAFGLMKLLYETMKHTGHARQWIPGYEERRERERLHKHYIYHCEQNPEGFGRLELENLKAEEID